MPFRIALSGLNAAQTDLGVTANNIANTSTNGFKGSRAEFADLFAVSLQGVSQQRHRQRRARRRRLAAVRPGQHRLHRLEPRPRDQRPGHVHRHRRRRARVHARRRVPARSRRLRRQLAAAAPAGLSAARRRRLQHRRPRRPAPADDGLAAGGHHQRRIPAESARERHAARRWRRSIRPIRTPSTRRLRSRCSTRWARLTPARCTSRRPRTPNEWTARLYIDGTAVGGAADAAVLEHRRC